MYTLKNPPIIEAILDIQVDISPNVDLLTLENIHKEIKEKFPNKEISNKWEGRIEIKQGEIPKASQDKTENGFWFKSKDAKSIFQARNDGFTFNSLGEYSNWKNFYSESKQLWDIYKQHTNPRRIKRIGLRYINSIQIPSAAKLKDYFTYIPEVLNEFYLDDALVRFVLRDKTTDHQAAILLAHNPQKTKNEGNNDYRFFVLDIDVYKLVDSTKDEKLDKIFNEFHEFKNKLFFECLTKKALESYE